MSPGPTIRTSISSIEMRKRFESRIDNLYQYLVSDGGFSEKLAPIQKPMEQLLAIRDLCIRERDAKLSWLFHCALAGGFPTEEMARDFHGEILNSTPNDSVSSLLLSASHTALRSTDPASRMAFLISEVLVDVDFSSQTDFTTGVQRVTRNLSKHWDDTHKITLVRWNEAKTYFRNLSPAESNRILGRTPTAPHQSENRHVMVVPVGSTIVFPEISSEQASTSIAALAAYSGNKCVSIGYDLIPVTSATLLSADETQKFVSYLSAIKYFDLVIAISASAATEFLGFTRMLVSQGISGPQIRTQSLPFERLLNQQTTSENTPNALPLVLCVGTIELRKNQRMVLSACEQLWQEGLKFELKFVGHASFQSASGFLTDVDVLHSRKRQVTVLHGIADDELNKLYENASFSVFASVHEGFGLPIAESVVHDLPVVATEYGSMSEIATHGRHLLVNPRSLNSVKEGIRKMLLGTNHPPKQHDEGSAINTSWANYADNVWNVIHEDF